jgi:hypothetical protein
MRFLTVTTHEGLTERSIGSELQSLFRLHVHMQLYSLAERDPETPPPAFGLIYEGAVGQPR